MDFTFEYAKVYKIYHQRKGVFIAQFLGVEEGDEVDAQLIHVRYDVRVGTDQAHLSTNLGKQKIRESNLRPSLIRKVELYDERHWLRELELPEPVPEDQPGLLDRIKGVFARKE